MQMYAVERRRWLVDHARETGRVDVADVARLLDVARETVRRDLNALEGEGLLRRVHGGAVPVERLGFEGRLALRTTARQESKSRIAEMALAHLNGAELIYIDEGSTAQAFADRLSPARPMTVVTNALPVAMVLAAREHLEVVLIGGRVRSTTLGTIDHWAVQMLGDFVFDLAVMGTTGVTPERGLTVPDAAVAGVKAMVMAASRRAVLLADGRKFGADSTYRFTQLRHVNLVITDRSAGDNMLRRVRGLGVEVVLA